MTVLLRNLPLALDRDEAALRDTAAEALGLPVASVALHSIVRRSLDARGRREPRFLYTVALELDPSTEAALLARRPPPVEAFSPPARVEVPPCVLRGAGPPPVVVGAGPAGLFAAWRLVQAGAAPLVIERGPEVTDRSRRWHRFLRGEAPFDPECNLLFGEGGAGAYSDGKLYTRVHDPRVRDVLELLAACGAPSDILYDAKPHVGSNLLPSVVRRLRRRLLDGGAQFRFDATMTGLQVAGGRVRCIVVGEDLEIDAAAVFLGLGHSARDTIRRLHEAGIAMERKPFQLGARIEHPQRVVNRMQYGRFAADPRLPAADYRLVAKLPGGDVFSFCMCPGGEILPATEKPGFICVNGASPLGRGGRFANSGFVITLDPDHFGGAGPLAGLELQERIEARAAALAAVPFGAPALRLADFLAGRSTRGALPDSSYPLQLTAAPFEEFLPAEVLGRLRRGLSELCRRFPALDSPEALIVGPESRSSCPVRILRDPATLESPSAGGLYPMGEGAGYAGGIVSAAIDGMRCAEAWLART